MFLCILLYHVPPTLAVMTAWYTGWHCMCSLWSLCIHLPEGRFHPRMAGGQRWRFHFLLHSRPVCGEELPLHLFLTWLGNLTCWWCAGTWRHPAPKGGVMPRAFSSENRPVPGPCYSFYSDFCPRAQHPPRWGLAPLVGYSTYKPLTSSRSVSDWALPPWWNVCTSLFKGMVIPDRNTLL